MRLLLDTHVFLRAVMNSPRLSSEARHKMTAAAAVYVSAASIWEIAIKARLFDRLLVAQAMTEPLALLTADKALARYSELVQVV